MCPNISNFDIEAHPYYEGEVPGTITLIGYLKERTKYLESPQRASRTVMHNPRPPTRFPAKYLLDRITHLKIHDSCLKSTEEVYYRDLRGSAGFTSIVGNDP